MSEEFCEPYKQCPSFRACSKSNAEAKFSKFVAKIADFEEAYLDTLTKKTQFAAEFWKFRPASKVLLHILRLDFEQALRNCLKS